MDKCWVPDDQRQAPNACATCSNHGWVHGQRLVWLMGQLGWILIATGMVTRTDSQLTIPRTWRSSTQSRFPIVRQAVQTRYSGPPDEKVSAPEQGIWVGDLVDHVYRHPGTRNMWVGDLMDQGVLGFGGPAVGLGVPRNRSISASDEFRALEQFRK